MTRVLHVLMLVIDERSNYAMFYIAFLLIPSNLLRVQILTSTWYMYMYPGYIDLVDLSTFAT